jgi:LAO/AO transport system kinase
MTGGAMESALRERPGCETPEAPRAAGRRRGLSHVEYVDGILRGDRLILARAITLVESGRDTDRERAERIIEDCLPHSGNSIRVGVTGVPGAGKSSVIEALGHYLTAERKEKVAVLAIDPSSQLSGGSILGDKTRMTALATDDLAFIRPSPSRGTLGGVAQRTREAMLLCEAAGYRNILVETVGVGQSETAVRDMVDFFLLIALAGAGDELQGIKRGVMELADLVAINKADSGNLQAAERARSEAQNALHFFPASRSGWTPRAQICSAVSGLGIRDLWACVTEHDTLTRGNSWREHVRREQTRSAMLTAIEQELTRRFEAHPAVRNRMAALECDVLEGRVTPFAAARELLDLYSAGQPSNPSKSSSSC